MHAESCRWHLVMAQYTHATKHPLCFDLLALGRGFRLLPRARKALEWHATAKEDDLLFGPGNYDVKNSLN
jgi:hypothetical protein